MLLKRFSAPVEIPKRHCAGGLLNLRPHWREP